MKTWWENQGVAPCYKDYKLAVRLKNGQHSKTFITDADITGWLPGDNIYNANIFIPREMPQGQYELHVAMVDKQSKEPRVNLAIEGKLPDGWYRIGDIEVNKLLLK